MSFNTTFEIVGALNYLKHHHLAEVAAKFPVFARQSERREPGLAVAAEGTLSLHQSTGSRRLRMRAGEAATSWTKAEVEAESLPQCELGGHNTKGV